MLIWLSSMSCDLYFVLRWLADMATFHEQRPLYSVCVNYLIWRHFMSSDLYFVCVDWLIWRHFMSSDLYFVCVDWLIWRHFMSSDFYFVCVDWLIWRNFMSSDLYFVCVDWLIWRHFMSSDLYFRIHVGYVWLSDWSVMTHRCVLLNNCFRSRSEEEIDVENASDRAISQTGSRHEGHFYEIKRE